MSDSSRPVGSQSEVPGLEAGIGRYRISGYQPYTITRFGRIELGSKKLRQKAEALRKALEPLPRQMSVVDIGCSAGALGMVCASEGFRDVTFVDHDPEYLDVVSRVTRRRLSRPRIRPRIVQGSLSEMHETHDVVLAFSLIHWVVSRTDEFEDVASIVRHLRSLTRSVLLIEWVDPADAAIKVGRHLDGLEDLEARYSREVFIAALEASFDQVRFVQDTRPTRALFAASVR